MRQIYGTRLCNVKEYYLRIGLEDNECCSFSGNRSTNLKHFEFYRVLVEDRSGFLNSEIIIEGFFVMKRDTVVRRTFRTYVRTKEEKPSFQRF